MGQVGGKTGVDRQEEEILSNTDLAYQITTLLHHTVFL